METLNIGNYYSLLAFSEEQAKGVLAALLIPLYRDDPLLKQQFEDFSAALVCELLRPPRDKRLCPDDEKSVLPVELQTVGMMMESVGTKSFSVSGLRMKGGKTGLLRDFIEDAKKYVWRKTGVSGDQALLILRQLISPAQTKWSQTAQSISSTLNIPVKQIESVLEAFGEKYLVNRLPGDDGNNEEKRQTTWKYELMHEHLVQVLIEAPDRTLQKARDAEERLLFWTRRTNLIFTDDRQNQVHTFKSRLTASFAQPIPVIESLMLWRHARAGSERRMLIRNFRGFGTRVFVFTIIPSLIALMSWILWTRTDSYIVHKVETEAPILQVISDQGEDVYMVKGNGISWKVNYAYDVREWFKAMVLENRITDAFALAGKITVARSRMSAYLGIVDALGKTDKSPDTEKALTEAIAAAREIKDMENRAKAVSIIAKVLGRQDESPGTEKALNDLLAVALDMKSDSNQYVALSAIAKALGKMDKSPETEKALNQVFSAAREIEDEYPRATALISTAEAYVKIGKSPDAEKVLTEAITTARKAAHFGSTQASILSSTAKVLGRLGKSPESEKILAKAIAAARGIKDDSEQNKALSDIAEALGNMGESPESGKLLAEVVTAARKIKSDDERAEALSSIAVTMGRRSKSNETDKMLMEATAAARNVEDRYHRAYALKRIAVAWAKLGNVSETEKVLTETIATARELELEPEQSDFLSFFADDLGKMGKSSETEKALNDAVAVTRGIKDESQRAYVLSSIVEALGKVGESPATEKTLADIFAAVREIRDGSKQAEVLSSLASILGEMGESPDTKKTLADIFTATREIKEDDSRAFVLVSIAEPLRKMGKLPRSEGLLSDLITAAHEIKGDYNARSRVLAAVAVTSAAYGNYHLSYSICGGEQCTASDKLRVFTAVLMEYVKTRNPALRKRLEDEEAEQAASEEEED
ncbi:MAG: hypothetical protein QOE33_2343 [Acidobacteriota bacterium]|nr:hypothetical protein [Acidobacteriota bacterium]